MSEPLAIRWLFHRVRSASIAAAPRYTPLGWWEADLWVVSNSRLATEYEIKVSRSDFKCDSKKNRTIMKRDQEAWIRVEQNKHSMLSEKSTLGPSRFFYCVPENMISIDEIPEWAGLIYFKSRGHCLSLLDIKPAPRLHTEKVSDKHIETINRNMAWRFWYMLNKQTDDLSRAR